MAEDKNLNPEELENVAGGQYVKTSDQKICPNCRKLYNNPPFENCEECGAKLEKLEPKRISFYD